MRYIKGIASDMPEVWRGRDVVVKSDYYDIEKAWVNDKGVLCVEFNDIDTLQEWNKAWRTRPEKHASMLQTMRFSTAVYQQQLYLFDTDDYGVCDDCGEVVQNTALTMVSGGDRVCEYCLENDYSYCEHCDTWHPDCDMVKIHTDTYSSCDHPYYVCENCAEDVAHCCERCGDWYEKQCCRLGADDNWYCEDCWGENFVTCEDCGEILWRDDAYYDEDSGNWYCEDCYNQHRGSVRSYHNNPKRVYHGAETDMAGENRYIGTEVETEKGDYDRRKEITEKYGHEEDDIYQMHDGSLDDSGIECITQPMTKMYWDDFDFEGWMKALSNAGARSHDTDDCGLHVHLSRTWLGTDDQDEQAVLVARMRQFIADNQAYVERFARRGANRWCVYSKTFEDKCYKEHYAKEVRKDLHKKKGYSGDRYQSVNNENRDTIEFRIFRGTLRASTYRASVEFCLRMVDYITTHEDGTETWQEFITYKPLPVLMEIYMKERYMQTTF